MLPQAPQLFGSDAMLMQAPLQFLSVVPHISPPVLVLFADVVVTPLGDVVAPFPEPGVGSVELLEHAAADPRTRVADKVRNLSVDFIPNSLR
jgi:hypothetical protein